MEDLKALFGERDSLPFGVKSLRLTRDIRVIKDRYVRNRDFVSILYLLSFLPEPEKDGVLSELLDKHRDSMLFVLAFGHEDSHAYFCATAMAMAEYENNQEAIDTDIDMTFDSCLSQFLSVHKEEVEYADFLVRQRIG